MLHFTKRKMAILLNIIIIGQVTYIDKIDDLESNNNHIKYYRENSQFKIYIKRLLQVNLYNNFRDYL